MTAHRTSAPAVPEIPNGSGAAALLAAGIGAFALSVLAIAGDQIAAVKSAMIFYRPTGPLSGVTTSAIIIWLIAWALLDARWKSRSVALGRIAAWALVLLALSLLLMFPPIADLF
ncbi:MAG TPA: hypothetical protein VMD55_00305 [Terracidiphilus sp.]|nr:hypothetical protein [Terracidiphilus sp.]